MATKGLGTEQKGTYSCHLDPCSSDLSSDYTIPLVTYAVHDPASQGIMVDSNRLNSGLCSTGAAMLVLIMAQELPRDKGAIEVGGPDC